MRIEMKKLLCAAFAAALLLSFAACSASVPMSPEAYYYSEGSSDYSYDLPAEAPMAAPVPYPEAEEKAEYEGYDSSTTADNGSMMSSVTGGGGTGAVQQQSKLIKTVYLNGETRDFDAALSSITADITAVGGYIESTSVSGKKPEQWSDNGRNAYMTARIPAEKLDEFLSGTRGRIDIINEESNVEDVGSHYYDLAARKETYEIQLQRLESILTEAAELADVLALETEIARVRYEIESIDTTLRGYDGRVSYSTVTISFYELTGFEKPQATEMTFGERIGTAFSEGFKNAGDFFKNAAVWLVGSLPAILVLLVVAAVVAVVIVKRVRTHKERTLQIPAKNRPAPTIEDPIQISEDEDKTTEENKTEE